MRKDVSVRIVSRIVLFTNHLTVTKIKLTGFTLNYKENIDRTIGLVVSCENYYLWIIVGCFYTKDLV